MPLYRIDFQGQKVKREKNGSLPSALRDIVLADNALGGTTLFGVLDFPLALRKKALDDKQNYLGLKGTEKSAYVVAASEEEARQKLLGNIGYVGKHFGFLIDPDTVVSYGKIAEGGRAF